MTESLQIGLIVVAAASLLTLVTHVIAKESKRAGVAIASTGSLLIMMLIVNYFVEVPVIIVAAIFAAFIGAMAFTLAENIGKRSQAPP